MRQSETPLMSWHDVLMAVAWTVLIAVVMGVGFVYLYNLVMG
jgi:hypothetical protein